METLRTDGRACDMLRPIILERAVNRYAEGSALIRWGNTHVLCTASVDDKVPPFLRGSGNGWITAEYAMLPRSTQSRMQREISRGKRDARGSEIQRLIGRSLRAAVDMTRLGERTITIDCDVLQADGGTRTASISAGFVALFDALRRMCADGKISEIPLKNQIAAVSVGKCRGVPLLDLCYEEDSDRTRRARRAPGHRRRRDLLARRARADARPSGARNRGNPPPADRSSRADGRRAEAV